MRHDVVVSLNCTLRGIARTLISLCSKNCSIMFLKYSTLISSSDFATAGEPGREGVSLVVRSDTEDRGERISGLLSCREAQYPTPGLRCRSSNAAEDCTLRSSSRRVLYKVLVKRTLIRCSQSPYCACEAAPRAPCHPRQAAEWPLSEH